MEELRPAIEAIQHAAFAYPLKALAPELNKAPSTLYDEFSMSPDSKAKLGFVDAVRIMRITRDHTPLHRLAAMFGYTLQKPQAPIPGVAVHHLVALRAVTDFLEAHERGEDYMALHRHLESAVSALEGLWTQRRGEAVSFCIRPAEGQAKAFDVSRLEPRSWWKRMWGKG